MTHPLHIDYIQPTPLALAVRESMYPTEHKGLKQWLGVIVAVAIPFVAPMISGAIASSGFLGATATGFFSTVGGSALVGAGLGGLGAAATGGDWKKGALMGGIGGYLGGAPKMGGAGVNTGTTTSQASDMAHAEIALDPAPGSAATLSEASDMAHAEIGLDPAVPGVAPQNIAPTADSALANKLDFVDPQNVNVNRMQSVGGGATKDIVASGDFWTDFKAGAAKSFTGENLGKKALQMGGSLVASAVGGMSDEQQELLEQQIAETERRQELGEEVDAAALIEMKRSLQMARNSNATEMARQRANATRVAGEKDTNNAIRMANLGYGSGSGARAAAIKRKGKIQTGRGAGSNYSSGMLAGVDIANKYAQQAFNVAPKTAGINSFANLSKAYTDAERQEEEFAKSWGNLFGRNQTDIS
jgi:hypothetical protein